MSTEQFLKQLSCVITERKHTPLKSSYVSHLFAQGQDAILQKIGEEATEVILAAKSGDRQQITHEMADLWFHCLVLLSERDMDVDIVIHELGKRRRTSED